MMSQFYCSVTFGLAALFATAVAQDISLDEDDGGISLGEKSEKKLSGAKPRLRTVSGAFTCASFPTDGDYLLCVCAAGEARLRVKVNDAVVFEGKKAFGPAAKFRVATFRIPAKVLKRGSSFSIENLSKEDFSVSYAVVLMTDRIRSAAPSDEEPIVEL